MPLDDVIINAITALQADAHLLGLVETSACWCPLIGLDRQNHSRLHTTHDDARAKMFYVRPF
jgi:hypothetical protein